MRTAVFDMDGLMFDTEAVFMKAWDYVGEKIGIGPAGFMVIETLGMNFEKTKQVWRQRFGGMCDEAQVIKLTHEFIEDYYAGNSVPVKKGLYNILQYLRSNGYKLAVASSSPQKDVLNHLEDAKVLQYFDVIVSGDMVERSKPEPDIYLEACRLLEAEPCHSYAFEDSECGLNAAIAAGCKTIMVPDLWQPDDSMRQRVEAVCADLDEVVNYIESRSRAATA